MSGDPKGARRALGRGLDALLPAPPQPSSSGASASAAERSVFLCPVEKITPQAGQPRQHFDEQELEELVTSIREHGLIEPLVVRRAQPGADKFTLIAGERRWRAAQRAGLKDVLVVVKDVSPKDAFELALVENIQRADLNPIEVAEAFDRLLREHGYSHQSLGERVGKDRTTIVNALRLLKLPQRIRSLVISRELSEGHGRALLGAPSEKAMTEIADKTVRGKLPVRKVEQLVRAAKDKSGGSGEGKGEKREAAGKPSAAIRDLEARLMRRLGTRVEVRDQGGGRGELAVAYGSLDELDRVLALIGA
jgi:ParB family transcriptional regulator, chromosome partitioning protein